MAGPIPFRERESVQRETRDLREMFGRIAPSYDRVNRLISIGVDRLWRRRAVRAVKAPSGARILDLCAGTGDMACEWLRCNGGEVVFADFSSPMLRLAGKKIGPQGHPVLADASDLPFLDDSFDIILCSYGLRNLNNLDQGLRSIHRVLRPGGRVAVLEFTREDRGAFHRGFREVVLRTITRIARCFSPDPSAYRYLSGSIREFSSSKELARAFEMAGFAKVSVKLLTLGLCALLTATKPEV